MSKAEEKAYEAYPFTAENRLNHEWNAKRVGFQQGYHQAEKDLELTWEDINIISECLSEVAEEIEVGQHKGCGLKGMYQEVLKRFKEMKEKK
jgi:hypothetical protein